MQRQLRRPTKNWKKEIVEFKWAEQTFKRQTDGTASDMIAGFANR